MKSPSRSLFANVPIKIIAVILCAVLIPSLLITALGLILVYEAASHVRSSFALPVGDSLGELSDHLSQTWQRRLDAYASYFEARGHTRARDGLRSSVESERRLPYLVQFRQDEPAVREVFVRVGGKLVFVDPFQPRALGSQAPSDALALLHELEIV